MRRLPIPDDEELEEIIVTGSRLVRGDLDSPSPVVIISREDIDQRGPVTIDEVLNIYPQLKPNNTRSQGIEGGTGITEVDLRGLGVTRSLVLVNGRRFIPAEPNGIVDLMTIPEGLIERIEVLTGGASAVYGSDAVAGAVNFILKDDFEGVQFDYSYGQTGESDGETHKIDFIIGTNVAGDRGNITVHGSWFDGEPVFFQDRPFTQIAFFESSDGTQLEPSGSSSIDGGGTINFDPLVGVPAEPAGCGFNLGVRFGTSGEPLPFCLDLDLFNFMPGNMLLRPLERYQVSALADYEIADGVSAFTEMFYVDSQNFFTIAPDGFRLGSVAFPNYAINTTLSQATRNFLVANANFLDIDGDGTAEFNLRRRNTEMGSRRGQYDRESISWTVGLRGGFERSNRGPWNWEAYYTFQQSDLAELRQNYLSSARLAVGLDVVVDPVTGEVSCRTQILSGCVPINILGIGALTPEMIAFGAPPLVNNSKFERQQFSASLAGDLFNLPAGPVPVAFGVEYREEEYVYTPAPAFAAGEFGRNQGPATSGKFDVTEFFAETRLPLIEDRLAVEAGVRFSDYSTLGNATTFKVGAEWNIVESLKFRAMYNEAIRSPNLNDLFSPVGFLNVPGTDPCAVANSPSQAVKDFCVQQGVPAGVIDTFVPIENFIGSTIGGNPLLEEEEAETITAGFVFSPTGISGLNITVDYWIITVDNAINQITAQQVLDACFATLDLNNNFCQSITRETFIGDIFLVESSLKNISELEVEGVDLALDYTMDLEGLALSGHGASINFTLRNTWQFKDEETTFAGQPPIECAGHYKSICSDFLTSMTPDLRGLASATWASGPATLGAQLTWIGEFTPAAGTTAAISRIPSITYFDLNASYEFTDNVSVSLGILNVLDEDPMIVGFEVAGDANVDPSLYDVIGRRYFVRLGTRF